MTTKTPMKDMVIILPGILGSVLQKDGKDLWAISGQSIWNLVTRSKETIKSLELGFDDPTLDDLGDGIRATALIEDVHLVPGLMKVDGYTQTTRMITDNFQVTQGDIYTDPVDKAANLYHFPYDWRRDNRVHARKLKALIDIRLKCWREKSGAADAKVILLAHSMGGLVSRYYLEVLGGWRDARALFTFGTPHRGSINGLNFLANDYKKLFFDLTNVMRSLTSVYQLLPIYPAVKIGEDFFRVTETDQIPNVISERAADARKFHDEIYDAVQSHKDDELYRTQFMTVPVVGIRQPTLQSAEMIDGKLVASKALPKVLQGRTDFIDGDGTVPKISAIPNELSSSFNNRFISEAHGALQNQKQVLECIREAISTTQLGDTGFNVRAMEMSIGLAVDDVYLPDEPIALSAQVSYQPDITGLNAVVTPVTSDAPPMTFAFERSSEQSGTEQWTLAIDTLPAGLYRVAVSAQGGPNQLLPSTVNNAFEVIDTTQM
ncbi:MAG: lecithin--cholesterol acyltransferase [Cyanobacteria bacterium P01_D01_bin.105]